MKYLDQYKKEYEAFLSLNKLSKNDLINLANLSGLKLESNIEKSDIIKKLLIQLDITLPINVNEWMVEKKRYDRDKCTGYCGSKYCDCSRWESRSDDSEHTSPGCRGVGCLIFMMFIPFSLLGLIFI